MAKEKEKKKPKPPEFVNRKAFHNYLVVERIEAGISLEGHEVKSIRQGGLNLLDAFCDVSGGEAWLVDLHISPYKNTADRAIDPARRRKLLLHKREIKKLDTKVKEKGFTLIPLKFYFKGGKVKVEIGLCKGKRLFDKKQDVADRDAQRAMDRESKGGDSY
jgi:SsrA-binding protein